MEDYQGNFIDLQSVRENYIEKLDKNNNDPTYSYTISEELFGCGLTVYCKETASLKYAFYKAFSQAMINPSIALHPEQLRAISEIEKNEATIISAPTSFGKTFCVFEYIARKKPKNVVLIVPTIALAKEYQLKIIRNNKKYFDYKIHSFIEDEKEYDFENENNLFILTHERAVSNSSYTKLSSIDLLVIDEVYKLDYKTEDDRTLVLNVALYYLTKIAKKYVLLAPFVKEIKNSQELVHHPKMLSLSYSPVINKVTEVKIDNDSQRFPMSLSIIKQNIGNKKVLVFIPRPDKIAEFIKTTLANEPEIIITDKTVLDFIDWAKTEIHPSWSLIDAIKKGYLVHHGSIPPGIRDYLLNIFDSDIGFNKMLCTSTLLEGVNTDAEYLIITKANRKSMTSNKGLFSAFDFYNLVGRTGRLNKYYVGKCYYIRTNDDQSYSKEDAAISVSFELMEKTEDIDIQINSANNSPEVIEYFQSIGLTPEEYTKKVGSPMRLRTFKDIKKGFDDNKSDLYAQLRSSNDWKVVHTISKITKSTNGIFPGIVQKIIRSGNRSVYSIVSELYETDYIRERLSIDQLIDQVLKVKSGILEHRFLSSFKVVVLLMEMEGVDKELIDMANNYISRPIEAMYYLNSPERKMLRSIGVYERDIDVIVTHIGKDFGDLEELKERLIAEKGKYYDSLCVVSKYEVDQFIKS